MFRLISVALACAAMWSLSSSAAAEATKSPVVRAVTMEEAVARALEASSSLRARDQLVTGAEAQIRQSVSLPNPTIEAELENFAGTGRFSNLNESELKLGVSQRIERGGKRDGRLAVATADHAVAKLEHERTRLNVVFAARKAFIEVIAAQESLEIATTRLTAATEIESMAARRVSAARDPLTVKLRAEIATVDARTAREQAEHVLHNAKRTLVLLWNEQRTEFVADKASLVVPSPDHKYESSARSTDIDARELAARLAAARLKLEKANASSDVSVGLGVRRFESGGDLAGVLSLSVPLAIFDTNEGNIDRAAAEHRAAELEVAEARQRLQIELVVIEEEVARSQAELDAVQGAMLPRARAALIEAKRGFGVGAFSYQEIAEAQRILIDLTAREINAWRSLHVAYASLDRLTGASTGHPSEGGTHP